ncbi:MAG: peptidase family protein [Marmoricola sp.]|nr:peptidase family protein [Marmoricola sp.]
MSRKAKVRIAVLGVLALVFLTAVAYYYVSGSHKPSPPPLVLVTDHKADTPAKPVPKVSYPGLPVMLKIPAIGVDAAIEYVGNTPQGNMAVPNGPVSVGWYKYGAIPGDLGTSVMAGHVVGPKGEPAVFKRLSELKAGNTLQVVDAKGQTASFMVREIKVYDESQQHNDVFTSTGGTHLNLITCEGDWDAKRRQYLQRLVVFADKTP